MDATEPIEATAPEAGIPAETDTPRAKGARARFTVLRRLLKGIIVGVALAGLMLLYAWRIDRGFAIAYREPDCDGYLLMAQRFAEGRLARFAPFDGYRYYEHFWVTNTQGYSVPKFTPGYPLLAALGYRLDGIRGLHLVNPALGAVALLAIFALIRLCAGNGWALVATAYLVGNISFLSYMSYPLTHAADFCFAALGFACLVEWTRNNRLLPAVGAGLCLGFAVVVRPANAVLLGAIGVAALAALTLGATRSAARRGMRPRRWGAPIAFGAAYALGVSVLMVYNFLEFGNVFRTGYDLTAESSAFRLATLQTNGTSAFLSFAKEVAPGLLPLAIAGLFVGVGPLKRVLALLWFLPLFLLMASYYWFLPNLAYLRMLLTCIPPMLMLAAGALDRATSGSRFRVPAIAMLALAGAFLQVGVGAQPVTGERLLRAMPARTVARGYGELLQRVSTICAPGSTIVAETTLSYTLFALNGYDVYRADGFLFPDEIIHGMKSGYGILTQPERTRAAEAFRAERSESAASEAMIDTLTRAIEDGRSAYIFAGSPRIRQRLLDLTQERFSVQQVFEWHEGRRYNLPAQVFLWKVEALPPPAAGTGQPVAAPPQDEIAAPTEPVTQAPPTVAPAAPPPPVEPGVPL